MTGARLALPSRSQPERTRVSYYLRAFCTTDGVPTLGAILGSAASQGTVLTRDPSTPPWTTEQLQDRPHDSVALCYHPDKPPSLVVDVDHADDLSGIAEEIEEFLERLEDVAPSPARDRIIRHLTRSRFIVAIRIPTSVLGTDHEEALWQASDLLLDYFVQHSDGLIQADGEGFYEAGTLILKLT
jgi:hypothetical protein